MMNYLQSFVNFHFKILLIACSEMYHRKDTEKKLGQIDYFGESI